MPSYVQAQQLAFPYGKRLVSGPHEHSAWAFVVADWIRADYADCNLTVVSRGSSKATLTANNARAIKHDLSTHKGRLAAATHISDYVRFELGVRADIEDWDGEPDVDIRTPSLRANIWLMHCRPAPMPIISWHRPKPGVLFRRLLPGAWDELIPHHKATSLPADWSELFLALTVGICASIDGSAFE